MNIQICFAFATGLSLGVTFLNIPPGLSVLMSLYQVNYTGISILLSALLWSHALMQLPAGMIADWLGVNRTLFVAMLFMTVGNLLPAISPILGVAMGGRIVTGIGTALAFVTTMKLVALHVPKGRAGAYQAFFSALFSFGNILAYYLIPKLLVWGWRWIFLTPAVFSILLLVLSVGMPPDSIRPSARHSMPLRRILVFKMAWVLGLLHALSWGTMINLGNWIPSLLSDLWLDFSPAQLAWGAMIVMFISGIGRVSGGFVLLRISPLLLINGSILILAFLFLGLFTADAPDLLLPLSLLAALFSSINFGAIFHLASTAVETGSLATVIGFINFLANLGAVLFTLLFGFSKDMTGSFANGFGVLAAVAAAAFPMGLFMLRKEQSGTLVHSRK